MVRLSVFEGLTTNVAWAGRKSMRIDEPIQVISPSPFALSLSKGISKRARGRFGKLRTGFDKLSPNGG